MVRIKKALEYLCFIRNVWSQLQDRGQTKIAVYVILAFIAEVWAFVEWLERPTVLLIGAMFAWVHIIAVVAVPIFPRVSSIILVADLLVFNISAYSTMGPTEIWGALLALGVIAYEMPIVCAISCLLVLLVDRLVVYSSYYDGLSIIMNTGSYVAIFLMPVLIGRLIVFEEKLREVKKKEFMLEMKRVEAQRNDAISVMLHDGVTGSLSLATRELQMCIRKKDCNVQLLRRINEYVIESLDYVHRSLQYLRDEVVDDEDFMDDISQKVDLLLKSEDWKLAMLGYKGQGILIGDSSNLSLDVSSELLSLVKECYTNICRHCSPGERYTMKIVISRTFIAIDTENAVGRQDCYADLNSGYGLSIHRSCIERLGGECNYGCIGEKWKLNARIPL